jgi:hypothetical protein
MNNIQNKTPIDILVEKGYDDVIIFRNPDYTDALIGLTDTNQAVYDYDAMVEWLVIHENMDEEEAADFISYNSSFYCGEPYPLVYYNDFEDDYGEDECEQVSFTRLEDLLDISCQTN